ncbi:MAG: ribonuclease J, partial [Blautia hydrogenotrophica]
MRKGKKSASKLKIIPLGGLEQIGMNITAFEYEESIVVVDCGLSFPEDDMLGIDLVIPDITYLKDNISKVKGFVITHGHEDHIGALPYVLKEVNVPIYSTKLTLGLITNKLKEHNLVKSTKLKEVCHGQVINLGHFSIEFVKTNHSIQDASALAIYSPAGIVVHTGDFKVDYTPVFGDAIDLQRFAEIGKKGVLALMCDSTNAERRGFTMSERTVGHVFDNLFNEYKDTRIIIATFASNVDRVQQIINSAYKFGRKVAVEGRSMVNVITTATELGYLKIPDKTLVEIDQIKNYPDDQVVLITTGSQGESMAALSRMAASIHKKVTIKPNDTIIFSSNPIPGNEKAVSKVINELSQKGANVIFQDAHVSGHACQEEIKLIYSLVHPHYAIPVHGEYRHLKAQAQIAESLGISKDNIFILESGNVLELDMDSAKVTGKVQTGAILVDGLGVGDVGNIVLRDRQHLA